MAPIPERGLPSSSYEQNQQRLGVSLNSDIGPRSDRLILLKSAEGTLDELSDLGATGEGGIMDSDQYEAFKRSDSTERSRRWS